MRRRDALALLPLLLTPAAAAWAAPRAEPWPRWERHDPASSATVDHSDWAAFLARHVRPAPDGVNRVAYGDVGAADHRLLAAYLDRLAATPVSRLARPEQMAYWINLYNALTVRVVLDHYPVGSIREINISPGLFSTGPWGAMLVAVEGERLCLDDIEHRILRPLWRDPRIHYAVNCASIGCPNLQMAPFLALGLDRDLDEAAIAYINHPRGVTVSADGRLTVSSIYVWFQDDFAGSARGVIQHLMAYAAPELAMALQKLARIDRHVYDWRLNDSRTLA
jgi:hypothetical protein